MKALTKISIGFLALVAVALWFTSCSSEDVASGTNQGNQESILLLSFNTGNMGTRGATTTNLTADEKKINDMTIGIYSSDGQRLRTVQKLTKADSEGEVTPGSNKFYMDGSGNAVAKIVTTAALTAGDQVLVAANTGSADFSKKGTADGFKSVEIDATTALTGTSAGTALTAATLPKFGTSSGNLKTTNNKSEFTASDIKLKNLVSKISLQKITVEFTNPGPYASATFEPQEMYLESVPNKMKFSETAWVDNPDSYLSGKDAADVKNFLKVTLSTPSGEGASKVLSVNHPTFTGTATDVLYTIPNSNTEANKTVLVIKGQFQGETNPVYYKLPLNVAGYKADGTPGDAVAAGTKAFQIPSGKNIKCNITIKTIGSTNPDAESGPLTATLTVTVDPWDDLDQTTTFE